jgi:hypothetical protein
MWSPRLSGDRVVTDPADPRVAVAVMWLVPVRRFMRAHPVDGDHGR